MEQNFASKIDVANQSNNPCKTTSRLANFSKVDQGVKNSGSSENLRDKSHTASIASTSNSKNQDKSNERYDIFHIIEMSPEKKTIVSY